MSVQSGSEGKRIQAPRPPVGEGGDRGGDQVEKQAPLEPGWAYTAIRGAPPSWSPKRAERSGPTLVGSTHKQRAEALGWAIRHTDPITENDRFNALFDCYLIALDYDEAGQQEEGS